MALTLFGGNDIDWRADGPATLDVAEFENAVRDAERAVTIYGGDLLPSCYDELLA